MEIGVYTFAETGPEHPPRQRLAELMEEIRLADEVGLDVFGVGEHHRPDFAVSAPAIILAAAAPVTKRIGLTSAVTVLSSDDPVRVFQQFATVDLLSNGRAEIMAGRGSFIESFPLFGQDLNDYDTLFAENLDLLLRIRADERVSWRGGTGPGHRPAIEDRGVYPRPERELPVWIAVGGTPQSVVRAGTLGLPLALAIIGGYPERFAPLVELYREAGRRAGHAREKLKVGINSHGFVADDPRRAGDTFFPPYAAMMGRIGRERGWPPLSRAQFDAGLDLRGHLVAGSPQQVIDKIMFQHELFHHDRFLLQISVGPLPHAEVLRAIELLGTKVAPVVRRETAAASLATEA